MLLRRLVHTLLALAAAALLPVALAGTGAPASTDGRAWLARINEAASQRNYQGTLVFSAGNAVSSSRIAHYCEGKQRFDRIELLDGQRRQVLRHDDVVHTLWPGSKIAVIEQRDPLTLFPGLLQQGAEDAVFDRYELQPEGTDRVAGHESLVFLLRPRDAHRYAQRLWAERDSGLLMRSDVLAADGRVLESSAFTEVRIGIRAQLDTVLQPMKKLDGYRVVRPAVVRTQLGSEGWSLSSPVAGFRQVSCVKRPLDAAAAARADSGAPAEVLQTVFSDGLTHVSVFIEPFDAGRHKPVLVSVGATNTLMRQRDDWWVTVMGDVPMETLKQFLGALERRP